MIGYRNVGHDPMEEAADRYSADLERWLENVP
jgi:hypothetical protein